LFIFESLPRVTTRALNVEVGGSVAGSVRLLAVLLVCRTTLPALSSPAAASVPERFQRVDTMPVFENSSADEHTAAEIAAVTSDGRTVVYTDSPGERIGFAKVGRGRPARAGRGARHAR
jgi:hypothetical protein